MKLYRNTENLGADLATMSSVCFCEDPTDCDGYSANHGGCEDVAAYDAELVEADIADESTVMEYEEYCLECGARAAAWEIMEHEFVVRDLWLRGYRAARYRDCGHSDNGTTTTTVRLFVREPICKATRRAINAGFEFVD